MNRAAALLAALLLGGCASCPPAWLTELPRQEGYLLAVGSCGEVFVEARAVDVALTRAARVLADRLGLDVEQRLSVVRSGQRLFVEAWGRGLRVAALDGLELVHDVLCQGRTHVLVRLPDPAHAARAP